MTPLRSLVVGALALLALPRLASAQEPPPPSPPDRFRAGVGLVLAIPYGEWVEDDQQLKPGFAPGFEADFGYALTPNIIIGAQLRHMRPFMEDSSDELDGFAYTTTDLGPMVRLEVPSGNMVLFADAALYLSTLSATYDFGGFRGSASENGAGVGGRAGARFAISPAMSIAVAAGASYAHITGEDPETEEILSLDIGWIMLAGDVVFSF